MEHVDTMLIYEMEESGSWDVVEGSLLCNTLFWYEVSLEMVYKVGSVIHNMVLRGSHLDGHVLTCLLDILTIFLLDFAIRWP